MSELSRALAPHLYPAPGRKYYGRCNRCGSELWPDDEWWKQTDLAVAPERLESLPEHPRKVYPLLLPCGCVSLFVKQLYSNSDGSYTYR